MWVLVTFLITFDPMHKGQQYILQDIRSETDVQCKAYGEDWKKKNPGMTFACIQDHRGPLPKIYGKNAEEDDTPISEKRNSK